ncbi:MAG: NADP-dependent oxidoreductase [Spirochaetes bacterium]|nr:NADP-dependent oxidoreductase [Spirochaetota bacterium]
MRAIVISGYGNPDKLELREMPRPVIADHEVLVEVHAAALNPVDAKIRAGKMWPLLTYKMPLILGNDIAGIVSETGKRVTRFRPGDRVFATLDKRRLGAFAEAVAVSEEYLAPVPAHLSFAEAAALPLVGLTVYQALQLVNFQPGQKVFIKAGAGGIGTFAIPYAKSRGAYVATTTSTANMGWVSKLGADLVIDYKKDRFEDLLSGYDIVLDSVDGEDVCRGLQILKPGGHLIALAGPPDAKFAHAFGANLFVQLACAALSWRETITAAMKGIHYHFLFVYPSGEQLRDIAQMVEQGAWKPVVDRVFAMDDMKAAFSYLEVGRAKGKVILSVK